MVQERLSPEFFGYHPYVVRKAISGSKKAIVAVPLRAVEPIERKAC